MIKNKKKGIPYTFYYENGKYVEIYSDKVKQTAEYFKKPKIVMTL